jgi:hypothetical protein
LLVGPEDARQFYDAIIDLHRRAGSPVNGQSLRYWKEALDCA